MTKRIYMLSLLLSITGIIVAQDSVLNRNVTVEREFQPIIQPTSKINQRPTAVEPNIPPVDVEYSDYMTEVNPDYNHSPLISQPTRFAQPKPLHGHIRAGIGHSNTLLDFSYRVDDGKKNYLDITVDHDAAWGRKSKAHSYVGARFSHQFQECTVYTGVFGMNRFFTRYGHYYNGGQGLTIDHYRQLAPDDKEAIWQAGAYVGVRSGQRSPIKYDISAGYHLYSIPGLALEHQPKLIAKMQWANNAHHAGGNISYQGNIYKIDASIAPLVINNVPRHNIRIEPYYEYVTQRILVHAGINLDVNVGKGTMFSNIEDVSFAPSPNVRLEAQLAPRWATVYAIAKGSYGRGNLENYVKNCDYLELRPSLSSHHLSSYTPVDAEVGFHFKPHKNLLMEIHAGYQLKKNATTFVATQDTFATPSPLYKDFLPGDINYLFSDYSRWKIGAAFSYHYQDIINIHLWGDYYIWKLLAIEDKARLGAIPVTDGRIYDRPDWELGLRIDARVDEHWTLYSDNHFAGQRWALTTTGDKRLRPIIDLNLGCQYEFDRRLAIFLELDNFICRFNDIYYGYQSQGIHGLIGVKWRF